MHAGIASADAGRFVAGALASRGDLRPQSSRPVTVIAAGKAAAAMTAAFVRLDAGPIGPVLVASTHGEGLLPAGVEWYQGGHPVPDDASERAGRRALELAAAAAGPLVVLLSGGASSLLAAPRRGLTLADKRAVTSRLMAAGADIHALNTVRKHLSAVKGGWLAATSRGPTLALAVSDVVDDDLSVIGSGPTVADPTTFSTALAVLDRFGGRAVYPPAAVRTLEAGEAGALAETPKPGDVRLFRATTVIVGSRHHVLRAAAGAARDAGYTPVVFEDPLVGEARRVATGHVERMLRAAGDGPTAVLSTGETTVRVTGSGRGGRNQELAIAASPSLDSWPRGAVFASVGTDGIDGPTDAAGGVADTTTISRVTALGLSLETALAANDSYTLLSALGDLVVTGRTDTNVGDLQVLLVE